jgi:putative ATP-dependent endonuclease of OLD family
LAQSCLRDDFHKAVHYGEKIKNSDKYALTDEKIADADKTVSDERSSWGDLTDEEIAYKIYSLMLDNKGKSGLKAIAAQCLASILKWKIAVVPDGMTQAKMFEMGLINGKWTKKRNRN